VFCRHCGQELAAIGELVSEIDGTPAPRLTWTVQYIWRHISTGRETCIVQHHAAVRDPQRVFKAIEAKLAKGDVAHGG